MKEEKRNPVEDNFHKRSKKTELESKYASSGGSIFIKSMIGLLNMSKNIIFLGKKYPEIKYREKG